MTSAQKRVLVAGIKIKLNRGERLEDILATYINLTEIDKQELRNYFNMEKEA
jgi:hypothetical protein